MAAIDRSIGSVPFVNCRYGIVVLVFMTLCFSHNMFFFLCIVHEHPRIESYHNDVHTTQRNTQCDTNHNDVTSRHVTGNSTTRSSTSRRRWRGPTRGSRKQHSSILHGRFSRSTDRTHHRFDRQSFLRGIRCRSSHHRKVPFVNSEQVRVQQTKGTKEGRSCLCNQ